jgi:hypothetical protein
MLGHPRDVISRRESEEVWFFESCENRTETGQLNCHASKEAIQPESQIPLYVLFKEGAGSRTRTDDLLITNVMPINISA